MTGGENVCCRKDATAGVPGIARCAVVGRPYPEWGETAAAALNRGAALDLASLTEALRGRIAADRMPRRLMIADALAPTGKVMKHVLRDRFVDAPVLQKQDR